MPGERLPALTGSVAAALAASCCLLPIALVAFGLAGTGLMMTMMRFEWLTLPLGVAGLAAACLADRRHRRTCATSGCRYVGRRVNQVVLGLATATVLAALLLRFFPSWTSRLLLAALD